MQKRRKRYLVLVLVVVATMALCEIGLLLPPRVTQVSAARVQPGMTMAEVEAILGTPIAYNDAVTAQYQPSRILHSPPDSLEIATWRGDGYVSVRFDADGRATRVEFLTDSLHRGLFREFREFVRRWIR
jgi:hypothetical protein